MKTTFIKIITVLFVVVLISGCAAKRIPITFDQAQPNALVDIKTVSGNTCSGVIQQKQSSYILLKEDRYSKSLTKLNRRDIAAISGREFVYDGRGEIISEWEIQENKKNKNLFYYTVGGAGLSFGASFFIGSMIHRGMDDEDTGSNVKWATTAVGTGLGTLFFSRAGSKKDRTISIEEIRDQRYKEVQSRVKTEQMKQKKINDQLQLEKEAELKNKEELKKLQEELKKREKK